MLLTGATLATLAVAVAVFLLLVDQMHQHSRWAARYPPGPMPLPGLGNLLQVNFQDPLLSFSQLRRRFGDVFSLQQVWTPVVVLNGLAAVREALVYRSQDTSDRPSATVYEHLGYGPRSEGVILARYGKAWREQRRFSLSTLRNFGLGKKSLEQWVTEEASCLCAAFADQAGRPFSPNALLNKAVSNVIASLTFGSRFEYNDLRILKLLDILEDGLKEEVGFVRQVLEAIPVLLRIPGLAAKVFPAQRAFMALIDELVTEHRMTRDRAQPPRDLTDAFLDEVEKAKGNPESSFNDENLRLVVSDLFSAGMITTSTTLAWALLLMILHPDVQRDDAHHQPVISAEGRDHLEEALPLPPGALPGCPGPLRQAGGLHTLLSRPPLVPWGAPRPHGALPLLHQPPAALQLLSARWAAPPQ
ncbi:cytochrome P450 2D14 isoform X9 [Eubalaena glacialis]|uniref:cytochrome P450 2D14 isoform X9 n=1 Tax=Eubalaena glacialis TaxID=27606 RepID=UPI002A59C208|nr:cytochrome P450 2D14 isoform X9 [Eubalaena glacialis]